MKWIENMNDVLAVLTIVVIIPGLWIAHKWITLPGEVIGATIMAWTLVLQYYYRRKKEG